MMSKTLLGVLTTFFEHPMTRLSGFALLFAVLASSACSTKSDEPAADSTASVTADSAAAMPTGHDMSSMGGMGEMTGDSDRDFLRMMSDHHTGMLLMTEPAIAKGVTVKDEAQRIAKDQTAEIATMKSTLASAYSDSYEPKAMADGTKMAGEIAAASGSALDKAFYDHTIMHHQAAIKMIDDYLPKSKRADVKSMAEKMKAMQLKEIKEFEGKRAAL